MLWYQTSGLDPDQLIPEPQEPLGARGVDFDILENLQAERGVLECDPVRPSLDDHLEPFEQGIIVSRIRVVVPIAITLITFVVVLVVVR